MPPRAGFGWPNPSRVPRQDRRPSCIAARGFWAEGLSRREVVQPGRVVADQRRIAGPVLLVQLLHPLGPRGLAPAADHAHVAWVLPHDPDLDPDVALQLPGLLGGLLAKLCLPIVSALRRQHDLS